jgi:hypothetical protein
MKQLFVYLWHLWFWRRGFLKMKPFLAVFHFQGIFLQKVSPLGVVVSEKMFIEKLTRARDHGIRSELISF